MLFLLPPSETKLDGGSGMSGLDLGSLSFPQLTPVRSATLSRLQELSVDEAASMAALKLGPRLVGEVARNRQVATSPVEPALARYTGVLYDAVRAAELDEAAWTWAGRHVLIHSALLGLVSASDRVPAYRLSHDSRLPGPSLVQTWREPLASVLAGVDDVVLDLRSEGYVKLGPAPEGRSAFLRVVSDEGGRRRALNHFNKRSKGLLVGALLRSRPDLRSWADLAAWAEGEGIELELGHGEVVLVSESLARAAA